MIRTLLELLGNFYASNDLNNFEAIARNIHSTVPGDLVSLQFLGLAYYRTGRIADAIRIFDKATHRKNATRAHLTENPADEQPVDEPKATLSCLESSRNNPDMAQVWFDLGTALQELGKHEQAIAAFQTAIASRPQFTEAMLASGQAALAIGNLPLAEDYFSRLRTLQPNNGKAYLGLGMVFRKQRDFATAHACLVRARLLLSGPLGITSLKSSRQSG
jgi:tetratricopeptide (TPR) repeat protein